MTSKQSIYLYRIEWAEVRPQQTLPREPLIAGGCHTAREARKLMGFAMGTRDFKRMKRLKGIAIIRSVRRIGLDTPAGRLKVEQIGPQRGRLHKRTS